jgi:response regulator RpfG family c-di-GMP phosphodiesterase
MHADENLTPNTNVVLYSLDRQGIFLLSEGGGLSALGLKPGEVVGRSIYEVYADIPEILENVRSALRGEITNAIVSTDSIIWDSWYYPTKNPDGEITGITGIAINVTEREKRNSEQEALIAISADLRKVDTRAEMLPVILDQIMTLLHATGAAVIFSNPANGNLKVEEAKGDLSSWSGKILPVDGKSWPSEMAQPLTDGTPYINNKAEIYLQSGLETAKDNTRVDPQTSEFAVAGIPLVTMRENIGALWVCRQLPFSSDEIRLTSAIGDLVGNALYRATQHELTQRHLDRLAALHDIDRAITGSLNLPLTLNVILDQVATQLGVHAVDVLLMNPLTKKLEFAAGRGFLSDKIKFSSLRLGEGLAGRVALQRRLVHEPDLSVGAGNCLRSSLVAREGFRTYYGTPLIAKGNIKGVMEIFHRDQLDPENEWLDFLESLATQAALAIDYSEMFSNLQRSNTKLHLAYDAMLESWVHTLDIRNKEPKGHTQRVTSLTLQLARLMMVDESELIHIRRGAILHDIGTMGISDQILKKNGPLTKEEREMINQHPKNAFELLNPIEVLRPTIDIPYCHHERWDGSGYPRGLKGKEIPLAARIFAVVDVWDILRSERPYRPQWTDDEAKTHIIESAGTLFDPSVVDVFFESQVK